ncbi:Acyl-CoA N-acyltransferase [Metarhizium album ARSEF 1941]|uniref:Acyl-CoA N-acyltransferase n=1 Tax=Metarhizium album (strain ARSEF 1941) TaxID=1081103 RepID=A0A0B2WUT1_METAS|nr:Acyl-CoA N-acyltransferase [Metarhizium album ARSEF 1941]KHN97374.1 Acyl-CoA N-acyltransferase [Metarhizium album ARSEF 1941]
MTAPDLQTPVIIRPANSTDLPAVKACLQEYTDWLDQDISFQNHKQEFANLPGKYAPPAGGLILAVDGPSGEVLGCIAFRPLSLDDDFVHPRHGRLRSCELKRLYVYPRARGREVARKLLQAAIKTAAQIGYDEMFLDTLPKMQSAIGLYKSEGFTPTRPYYFNPLEGALFFSKPLRGDHTHPRGSG